MHPTNGLAGLVLSSGNNMSRERGDLFRGTKLMISGYGILEPLRTTREFGKVREYLLLALEYRVD